MKLIRKITEKILENDPVISGRLEAVEKLAKQNEIAAEIFRKIADNEQLLDKRINQLTISCLVIAISQFLIAISVIVIRLL